MDTSPDGLESVVGLFRAGFSLVALVIYAPTIVCAWFAIKRLRRKLSDPFAYLLIAGALVVPALYTIPMIIDEARLKVRAAEVASWPKVVPNPIPRTLVIHARRADPTESDYALELAESGLFDVYLVTSRNNWKAELSERPDCGAIRTTRTRFSALTGFRTCAVLVKTDSLPEEGLVLYEGPYNTPLSPKNLGRPGDAHRRINWTIQLSSRHDGKEDLVAYEESIQKKTYRTIGIFMFPGLEEQPMRQVTSGSRTTYLPDPAEFIYTNLGIDPAALRPAFEVDRAELESLVTALLARADRKSAKAIARLAATLPTKEAVLEDALRQVTTEKTLRGSLWEGPIDCAYANGLSRYVREIGEGCEAGERRNIDRCAAFSSVEDWHLICKPDKQPAWSTRQEGRTRVVIDGLFSSVRADITIAKRYEYQLRVKEVVVPADRGVIDLVVHGEGFWYFSGAITCLASVGVIESGAGVIGVPADKVRFIDSRNHAYVADGHNAERGTLTPKMLETLGAKPDVAVFDHREDVLDLDAFMKPESSQTPCPSSPPTQELAAETDEVVKLDLDAVVLPPLAVPVHYRER